MGIALVLLGLLSAAVVIDFVIENDLAGAPDRTFALFGGSFTFNQTEIVLTAAVLGGFAVLFLVLGLGLSRGSWGRRRALRHRVSDLERENDDLRSRPAVVTPVPVVPDRMVDVRTDDDREEARRPEAYAALREEAEREAAERQAFAAEHEADTRT
jgi:hypothetical protein